MAVILLGAGDYESALRLMGEASALGAFAEGRDRNIRRAAMLQGIRLRDEQLDMQKAAIEKADAEKAANYLAAAFGGVDGSGLYGAGGARSGRRRSSGGQGFSVDPATNLDAIRALEDEAAKAVVAESEEIDATRRLLAKEQAEQFRLHDQLRDQRAALAPTPAPRALVGDAIVAAEEQRNKEALTKQRLSNIAELLQGSPPGIDRLPADPKSIASRQRPIGDELSRARLARLPEAEPRPQGAWLGDVTAEEIDQFARERGVDPSQLVYALGALTKPGFDPESTAYSSSGDPNSKLMRAIEEFKRRRALAPGRPKDISEPEWQALQQDRAAYSKLAAGPGRPYWSEDGQLRTGPLGSDVIPGVSSTPFNEQAAVYDPATGGPVSKDPRTAPEDAGIAGRTRLWRADDLKGFSEDEIVALGGKKQVKGSGVNKGEVTYWLPESATPILSKGGPVDDTGGQAGTGALAELNERLGKSQVKAGDLRRSIRKLQRSKAGYSLKNPFEEFGKPSTFMPSIQTVSYAVDMARSGRPGGTDLIAQMIGREPYPSEIRRLNKLVSDYQDFAGGVSAKRTEITRGRVKDAQDAASAQALAQQRRFSSMTRGLLAGSIREADPEFLDFASDSLGTLWVDYPEDAQKLLAKYVSMGEKERDRFIAREKERRSKEGSESGGPGFGNMKANQLFSLAQEANTDMETLRAQALNIQKSITAGEMQGGLGTALAKSEEGSELTSRVDPTEDLWVLPSLREVNAGDYLLPGTEARHQKAQALLNSLRSQYNEAAARKDLWTERGNSVIGVNGKKAAPKKAAPAGTNAPTLTSLGNAFVIDRGLDWDPVKKLWIVEVDGKEKGYKTEQIEAFVAQQSGK